MEIENTPKKKPALSQQTKNRRFNKLQQLIQKSDYFEEDQVKI